MKSKKIEYKWVIVVLSFLMVLTVLGFCSSAKSLYISPITEALSISRSAFSVNDSLRYISTAVINLFFGFLIARFGEKKLIAAGFICLICSCLVYSFSTNVFGFYIGGILLGVGLSWTTTTIVGAIINKWFDKNQGTIMGAVLASNGIGAAIAIQILSPIIYQQGNPFGYRDAYRLVAIILAVVFVIMMIFFKTAPKKEKTEQDNKESVAEVIEDETVSPMHKKYFYVAALCIFLTGMVIQGVSGIYAPLMRDVGIDDAFVSSALSIHSVCIAFSKFAVGFAHDKLGLRKTANICLLVGAGVMFLLACVTGSETGKILALGFGILSSIAIPLETVMLPLYAKDLFGKKTFSKVLGIFVSVNTAGYAVGAPVANLCYDLLGDYKLALYISGVILIGVTVMMQWVIKTAHRENLSMK